MVTDMEAFGAQERVWTVQHATVGKTFWPAFGAFSRLSLESARRGLPSQAPRRHLRRRGIQSRFESKPKGGPKLMESPPLRCFKRIPSVSEFLRAHPSRNR